MPEVLKGGAVAKSAAMLCQNPVFRTWLGVMREYPNPCELSESDAAKWLRSACKVNSRAMLDHDGYGRWMFNKIRNQFLSDIRQQEYEKQFGYQPLRNEAYLTWVRSLPCVITGQPGADAHHVIGHGAGGMGTKASDLFAFPLIRAEHSALHDQGYKTWESRHGSQWVFVAKTLERAVIEGVLLVAG